MPTSSPPAALPRFRRTGPSFQDLFGVPAADVLTSMDRAGDDVPSGRPFHELDIDAVGMQMRSVVIGIQDPFGSARDVHVVCTVRVSATVPGSRRGVHASRIGDVIAESATMMYRDLPEYAGRVAEAVARSQYGGARVTVHGRLPYAEEIQADRSSRCKLSLEHLHLIVRQTVRGARMATDVGLRVDHLIACPCVQKTYQHAHRIREGSAEGIGSDERLPLMTHSQRCATSVLVCGVDESRSPVDMLARLDRVLVRTSSTLPRDAELMCVYRAHRAPQFIEDALRAAVVAVADLWAPPASFRAIVGRSRSLESIHPHDLTAALTLQASDVR